MPLTHHPRFGELPYCTQCERQSWQALLETTGPDRAIAVFRCEACSCIGTAYAPVDADDTVPPDAVVEFGGTFEV